MVVMKLEDAVASVKLVLDWCYQITNNSDVFISDMLQLSQYLHQLIQVFSEINWLSSVAME